MAVVVNKVMVEMLNIMERAVDVQRRDETPTSSSTLGATSTSATPSATTSANNNSSNGPTSSPLLFFVALGFGVVFTNLWIIVGVKYCFRYNARNRQMRIGEDGEPINMENIPRPHRRRREKKLMSMDEVNERFPLTKYKNWVASRASEGLPTAGGVTAPPSRAGSIHHVEGIEPASPKTPTRKSGDALREASEDTSGASPEDSEKSTASHVEVDTLPALEQVKTTASTVDPKHPTIAEEDEEDDEEHIHTAVPPELLQSPGDSCAICIDTLEDDDDIRGLTCGHAFHASCLDPWLTSRRACCPLCKADYYVPKPRPDGEPVEAERETRRSRRMDSNGRRMNMPQAPASVYTWTGASRNGSRLSRNSQFSSFRSPRSIMPSRLTSNPNNSGDGYDADGRRREGQPHPDHAGVFVNRAESGWRSTYHVPNPFRNLRMPAMPAMPGRNRRQQNATNTTTPAQLEEGTTN